MRARGVSRDETRGDGGAERSSGSARSRARTNRATTGWARRVPDLLALVAALVLALTLRERTRVPIHGCARARTRTTRRIPRTRPRSIARDVSSAHARSLTLPPPFPLRAVPPAPSCPISSPDDFAPMRAAGALAASALIHVAPSVRPGVSTAALDAIVASFIRSSAGGRAKAATVGYRGYAHASCVSVNDVVCHGVPSVAVILEEGDVVNVDVTVELDGWHGDTSRTFLVTRFGGWDGGGGDEAGEEGGGGGDFYLRFDESSEAREDSDEDASDPRLRFATIASRFANATRLIRATKRALALGLRSCRAGARIGDVTGPIRASLESEGYGVVDSYAAHGIGRRFHQPPRILHGARRAGSGFELRRGMFFTIEPMANEGTKRTRGPLREDGWSVVTADGGLSAQFEHTVGVGFGADGACEIFTAPPPRRTRAREGREEEAEVAES